MQYKIVLISIFLIVLVGGVLFYVQSSSRQDVAPEASSDVPTRDIYLEQFTDEAIGLAFDYPAGPDGYVVDDLTASIGDDTAGLDVLAVYRIMNAKDKVELETAEGGREGPPAMQLMVFENELNQSALLWVDRYPRFSNVNLLLGELATDEVVGGANAVRYTTDGLYLTNNTVVAHGGYVYHFTGSYLEPGSLIQQDFEALIDSVRFIPPTESSADTKIDPRVACESALAYMLFETGEQADQFVAECIAGEHPEVIQRYVDETQPTEPSPRITVTTPTPNQVVPSPIAVTGEAQGNWFFEATAPVVVVDWDGRIIGEGYITAEGEWMTEALVPFSGSVSYDLPADSYSTAGTVIIQRANPSDLPENDAAIEVSVQLQK